MKIGAFAKKFNLNISAVRFYINNGLLNPDKASGQYEFGRECVVDMENILKYKKYQFSLEEIQLLFFMERATHLQDEIVLEVCAEIMKKKLSALRQERENLTDYISQLEHEIENFPIYRLQEIAGSGIPYSFIPYLYCPKCQKPLNLDSASLSKGSIQKGFLLCDCGYKAEIVDGIVLCEDFTEETPFKAFDNVDSVMSMKNQFSAEYRMLIKKAYIWMYNQIANQQDEAKLILAGPFTLNFLLEYIEKFGKNNTYIIFDPSLKRIGKLKKYLSSWNFNIIYIVGKPEMLPIKRGTVNIYIDDYSTVNSLFTYNTFSTEHIGPLLKHLGEVIGLFSTYQKAPKSIGNFKRDHPAFEPERMTLGKLRSSWVLQDVHIVNEKSIGATNPMEQHYPQDVLGEQVEVHGYFAKKDSK